VVVRLTPRGRALVQRVFPRALAAIVGEFSVLSAGELVRLARLCRKLGLASGPRQAARRPRS
jgi:DNA-binding MarR family transcriptional regulator